MRPTPPPLPPILRALEATPGPSGKPSRRKVARPADTFCAEGRLPADALAVAVSGLGPMASPLAAVTAQALHAASEPAHHGRRDKTLLDKRVRDTGVVAAEQQFFPPAGPSLRPWVLLLDHEYSQHGLHWPLLKGADRPRVAALRAAAEALGLRVHLALAEVYEHWTAFDGGRRGGGRQPEELIDRGIVLEHWVDANDKALPRDKLPIAEADTASFTETDESFLVNEEYEGYMGNYGETLEYGFRRAALRDATQARGLMDGFDWARLQAADARALARLSARRGEAWTADLINAWAQPAEAWRQPGWHVGDEDDAGRTETRAPWPQPLTPFLAAGQAAGLGQGLIDQMLQRCLQALGVADSSQAEKSPAMRAASFPARLQALCDLAAATAYATDTAKACSLLVRHVLAQPSLYPRPRLRPLVSALPAGAAAASTALREAVIGALRQALAAPERSADDHSLEHIEWVCRCADCSAVIRWAESAQAQALTLAMAEARRGHVQQKLSAAGAPLVCTTLRQGSPHKLVVSKAGGLHESRRALRRQWQVDWGALGG